MITITTLEDIATLSSSDTLSPALLQLLWSEFEMLSESYRYSQPDLDMTTDGPIFLLEPGDDPSDLPQIGLPKDSGGLLGSRPEVVQRLTLPDGLVTYRMILIQTNQYSPTVFLCPKQLAPEVRRWLEAERLRSAFNMNDGQID